MTRIACISDTHLRHLFFPLQIPESDILIHAGDATLSGDFFEIRDFFEWFGALPHRIKIFVAGNHDWLFQRKPALARSLVPDGVVYLQDDMVEVEGLKIYGSPWQPEFQGWAFNLPRGYRLREKWDMIPSGIDVLVTHGPPLSILDLNYSGDHVGCGDLYEAVKRVKPRLHVFGHIHVSYGVAKAGNTLFVNASTCDEAYRPSNKPIVVDIGPEAVSVVDLHPVVRPEGPRPLLDTTPHLF